jgi:glycerol-3-phosphate dehydrogenase (NAD(P)+)
MKTIAVVGAGSWGTALAVHLARVGHDVRLWVREPELVGDMRDLRENREYLPGVVLPPNLVATNDLGEVLDGLGLVLTAVPSHGTREVMSHVARLIAPGAVVVSATKGIEEQSLQRMSQVIAQQLGDDHPIVVLSGPSFALEVARELPTAVVAASSSSDAAALVQQEFRGRAFRLYASDDVVGVEVAGALKNVMAIAAGVVDSLDLGQNAMAALITRGLAEMSRLAFALGGRRDTLAGLSGVGDLVLTCTGSLSRNRHVGIELGRGRSLPEILGAMKMVAEGVKTTQAALALGQQHGVELPITEKMDDIMAGRVDARTAAEELMLRRQRIESERG